jgi:hypothetical protein
VAIAMIINDFPEGAGPDMYDQVNAEMGVEGNPPQGLIFHWAGEVNGEWTISDIWESRADYDRFVEERLNPALEKVAGPEALAPDAPQTTQTEVQVYNYFKS